MTDKYFTIVFKDLTSEERVALWNAYSDKISGSSYSHAMDDRDQLLGVLSYAECALGDIGDADREPGDDLEWCERRAAEALPRVREMLLAHGKTTTALTTMTHRPQTPPPDLVEKLKNEALVGGIVPSDYVTRLITKSYASGWDQRGAVNEAELQKARDEELEACCEVLHQHDCGSSHLRLARRPQPPSLKEQATAELDEAVMRGDCITTTNAIPLLRAALNRLAELEGRVDA